MKTQDLQEAEVSQAQEIEKPRTIALVGIRNLFAYHLLRQLPGREDVQRVIALDVHPSSTQKAPVHPKIISHKIELTHPTSDTQLASLLQEEEVDTLLHLAFLQQPVRDTSWAHEFESIGTMHILNACAAVQLPRLIVRSSTAVYGPDPRNPGYLKEEHPLYPSKRIPFIRDKVDAERQIRSFCGWNTHTKVTTLRFCSILGPNSRDFIIPYLGIRVGRRLLGHDPLLQLLHEEDAVRAMQQVIFAQHPGVYNITPEGVLPLSVVLGMMRRRRVPLPLAFARPLLRTLWLLELENFPPAFIDFLRYSCIADNTRAREELGFRARFSTHEAATLYRQELLARR